MPESTPSLDEPPDEEELEKAIYKMRRGKAGGK